MRLEAARLAGSRRVRAAESPHARRRRRRRGGRRTWRRRRLERRRDARRRRRSGRRRRWRGGGGGDGGGGRGDPGCKGAARRRPRRRGGRRRRRLAAEAEAAAQREAEAAARREAEAAARERPKRSRWQPRRRRRRWRRRRDSVSPGGGGRGDAPGGEGARAQSRGAARLGQRRGCREELTVAGGMDDSSIRRARAAAAVAAAAVDRGRGAGRPSSLYAPRAAAEAEESRRRSAGRAAALSKSTGTPNWRRRPDAAALRWWVRGRGVPGPSCCASRPPSLPPLSAPRPHHPAGPRPSRLEMNRPTSDSAPSVWRPAVGRSVQPPPPPPPRCNNWRVKAELASSDAATSSPSPRGCSTTTAPLLSPRSATAPDGGLGRCGVTSVWS